MNAIDFGFTDDKSMLDAAYAWRDAAVSDGWFLTQTYASEDVDRSFTLTKDGFKVSGITRTDLSNRKWKYEVSINGWGPDGMVIKLPKIYDGEIIKKGINHCNYCNADNVKTERVGFAGRCCANCIGAQRAISEKPGWNN